MNKDEIKNKMNKDEIREGIDKEMFSNLDKKIIDIRKNSSIMSIVGLGVFLSSTRQMILEDLKQHIVCKIYIAIWEEIEQMVISLKNDNEERRAIQISRLKDYIKKINDLPIEDAIIETVKRSMKENKVFTKIFNSRKRKLEEYDIYENQKRNLLTNLEKQRLTDTKNRLKISIKNYDSIIVELNEIRKKTINRLDYLRIEYKILDLLESKHILFLDYLDIKKKIKQIELHDCEEIVSI